MKFLGKEKVYCSCLEVTFQDQATTQTEIWRKLAMVEWVCIPVTSQRVQMSPVHSFLINILANILFVSFYDYIHELDQVSTLLTWDFREQMPEFWGTYLLYLWWIIHYFLFNSYDFHILSSSGLIIGFWVSFLFQYFLF